VALKQKGKASMEHAGVVDWLDTEKTNCNRTLHQPHRHRRRSIFNQRRWHRNPLCRIQGIDLGGEVIDIRQLAFEDWKRGMEPKDIAKKHTTAENKLEANTVSQWAKRHWKNDRKAVIIRERHIAKMTGKPKPKMTPKSPTINRRGFLRGGSDGAQHDTTVTKNQDANTVHPNTGNQNAVGNRGGKGAPLNNTYGEKTSEFSRLYFANASPAEKLMIEASRSTDEIERLEELIRDLILRELKIKERITAIEKAATPLVPETVRIITNGRDVVSEARDGTKYKKARPGKDDFKETTAVAKDNRLIQLWEALTRVQNTRARYEATLFRMKEERDKKMLDAQGGALPVFYSGDKDLLE